MRIYITTQVDTGDKLLVRNMMLQKSRCKFNKGIWSKFSDNIGNKIFKTDKHIYSIKIYQGRKKMDQIVEDNACVELGEWNINFKPKGMIELLYEGDDKVFNSPNNCITLNDFGPAKEVDYYLFNKPLRGNILVG